MKNREIRSSGTAGYFSWNGFKKINLFAISVTEIYFKFYFKRKIVVHFTRIERINQHFFIFTYYHFFLIRNAALWKGLHGIIFSFQKKKKKNPVYFNFWAVKCRSGRALQLLHYIFPFFSASCLDISRNIFFTIAWYLTAIFKNLWLLTMILIPGLKNPMKMKK